MRIRTKFLVSLVSLALITGVVVAAITHRLTTDLLERQIHTHLETTAQSRAQHVETYLRVARREVEMMATSFVFRSFLLASQGHGDHAAQYEIVTARLDSMLDVRDGPSQLLILDENGIVLASTEESSVGRDTGAKPIFPQGGVESHIACPRVCTITGEHVLPVSAPIVENNELLGIVVASVPMSKLDEITRWGTGLGETGEVYLVDNEGYMLTPSRFVDDTFLKQKIDTANTPCGVGVAQYLGVDEHGDRVVLSKNYLGIDVLGMHTPIPEVGWCLVAEQSVEEAFAPVATLTRTVVAVFLVLSAWGIVFAVAASRTITDPIQRLREGVEELARGHLDHRVGTEARDEIGELSRAFDVMAADLRESRERLEDQSKDLAQEVEERTRQLAENERQRFAILNIAQDMELANLELETEVTERVQVEESLHRRDAILEAIGHAAARLLKEAKWEQNIEEVLRRLGLATGVTRVALFKNRLGDDGDILTSHLFEWNAPGLTLPVDNSERSWLPFSRRWFCALGRDSGPRRPHPRPRQRFPYQRARKTGGRPVTHQIHRSGAHLRRRGMVGVPCFDDYLAERAWSRAEIEALKTAASLLGATIQRRQAEEERTRLEAELLQSQKMQAIGQLAGGVAHDFNNILTVIQGYTEFALMSIGEDDPIWRDLTEVRRASVRATNLTRQLLLFSRRQPMAMLPLNINRTVQDLTKMLVRLIGEEIALTTNLEHNLWTIEGDSGTIEQVVMNLVVNSRDALPQGGEISIQTQNLRVDEEYCQTHTYARPGEFVCLSVTDTGTGIGPDIIDRIFEPFFTTKGPGKGTGMGLPVVYGIVKQHEGWIDVESSPGEGSTFRVYLPATSVQPTQEQEPSVSTEVSRGKGERILLVEDEESIRDFAFRGLSEHGYVVYPAANVQEALDVFQDNDGDFDLIFNDLVLPDGSGLKLAQRLLDLRPDTKVVFASGYSADKEDWRVIHEEGHPFLQKPYSLSALLGVVCEVLG